MAANKQIEIQDRRGFYPVLVLGASLTVAGSGWILCGPSTHHFFVGLGLCCFGAIVWHTAERTSRPPPNDPHHFVRFCQSTNLPDKRPPVLVCLGDSLTHGNCSANVVDSIVPTLCRKLALPFSSRNRILFSVQNPVWVVNAGQNNICSWTVCQERVDRVLACNPDHVMVWIGTNDLRSIYKRSWSRQMVCMWKLPQDPSLEGLQDNLQSILTRLLQHDSVKNVGVCTLPPMGEDLTHPANQIVKRANVLIETTVAQQRDNRCTVLPVYEALEEKILSRSQSQRKPLAVDYFLIVSSFMGALHHVFGVSWTVLSRFIGNTVLSDSLHLNETGRDVVVNVVVDWLTEIGINKSIRQ